MRLSLPLCAILLIAGCLWGNSGAQGADWKPVIRHDGTHDPHDAGWQLSSQRIQTGSGQETVNGRVWTYWQVADRGGEDGLYEFPLSEEQVSGPWRITVVARLVDTNARGTGFGAVLVDGQYYWRLNFNKDGIYYDSYNGQSTRFGAPLDTTDDYHRYELCIEPVASCDLGAADRVTLKVDGKVHARLRRRDFRRIRTARTIGFGSTNSGATGEVRYHLVEFATIAADEKPVSYTHLTLPTKA